jgi:hypothetical protein
MERAMTVRWGSLVADVAGEVDYVRVRSLVAVVLALVGGLALTLSMLGLIHPGEYVTLGTSALVLPITAGKIADVVVGRRSTP